MDTHFSCRWSDSEGTLVKYNDPAVVLHGLDKWCLGSDGASEAADIDHGLAAADIHIMEFRAVKTPKNPCLKSQTAHIK